MIHDWSLELAAALDAEYVAGAPRLCALASVDVAGRPQVRMMVLRALETDRTLTLTSDSRSQKSRQLRHQPQAQLLIWLPCQREQYRIAGPVTVIGPEAANARRLDIWRQLSDATRATFFWPEPGAAREPSGEFPAGVGAQINPPDDFELLVLNAHRCERLRLREHPHQRCVWPDAQSNLSYDANP